MVNHSLLSPRVHSIIFLLKIKIFLVLQNLALELLVVLFIVDPWLWLWFWPDL